MKTLTRVLAIAAVIGLLGVTTGVPAYAQSKDNEPVRFDELCLRIKNRLNVRVGNVSASRDENISTYEGLNKRFEKVISAADKKEYDTTTMKAALEESRTAIATYNSTGTSYSNQLKTTANDACVTETNYRTNIDVARTNIKTARDAGLNVRNTFQYSIIPELRAYKVWLNELATPSTDEQPAADSSETPATGEAL